MMAVACLSVLAAAGQSPEKTLSTVPAAAESELPADRPAEAAAEDSGPNLLAGVSADTAVRDSAVPLLERGKRRGELRFAVGGHSITLGPVGSRKQRRVTIYAPIGFSQRAFTLGLHGVEFGYSLLTKPDYAGYAPEEVGFLDQRVGKSIHVGLRLLGLEIDLNSSRTVALTTGISLSFDNYRLDNSRTIRKIDGRIVPVPLEGRRKSKLATTQFGVPLGLTFTPLRRMRLSAFAFGELVVNAHTKSKKPKQKAHLNGLNDFRFGVQGVVTYANLGVYVKYSFTPMFETGTGPRCRPLSVGIAWGF